MRAILLTSAIAALALSSPAGAGSVPPPPANPLALPAFDAVPAADVPVVKAHEYVMAGAVRPLLFWIRRDDIGLARIVWRGHAGGPRGYEFLVGTDPARAPRAINRWGFISEEAHDAGGSLVALMTGSHDTSYETEAAAASQGQGAGDFRAIRSQTADRTATWQLTRVRTPGALTVHQVADALGYLRREGGQGTPRQRSVSADARPGFLVAVADLLDEVVAGAQRGSTAPPTRTVPYVFGSQTYRLHVRRVEPTTTMSGGHPIATLRTSFETRTVETAAVSRFDLTAGTSGELAGVPLFIEWQPHWWLRVSLRLADAGRDR